MHILAFILILIGISKLLLTASINSEDYVDRIELDTPIAPETMVRIVFGIIIFESILEIICGLLLIGII